VGFDDSPAARRALERGIAEAGQRKSRLIVLSVFEVPLDPQVDRFFGTLDDIADWEASRSRRRPSWSGCSGRRATRSRRRGSTPSSCGRPASRATR
jgi:hypothetical protein